MPTLKIKNLYKHFDGIKAVDRLTLSFEAGKITGLIGPNGSGKSTLINLLTGVVPFDSGTVIVAETTKLSKVRPYEVASLGITRTFQDVKLFEQMPVMDNILVVLTKRSVAGSLFERHKKYHIEKAKEVLEKVGLWEKKDELAANLSYGQRKLLEIARTLAMNAETYLFDEPFAGLFPEMIKIVSSVLKELRDEGKTVVLVEHNMELIRELSDYCIVMDSGEFLAEGKTSDVLSQKVVMEAYLGE
jgi:ABC-type branched-subunit amino acid transport system ATPase component